MLIQVHYPDNRFDYVKDHMLHSLIESKQIESFKRSSGWVTVGVDPVRQFNRGFQHKPNSYQKPVIEAKSIIRVVFNNNRCDYVTGEILDNLLKLNKISKFQRSSGWVTVGVDSVRKAKREHTYRYPNELKKSAL